MVLFAVSLALGLSARAADAKAPAGVQQQIASLEAEIVAKAEQIAELSTLGDKRQVAIFQLARFKAVYGDRVPTNVPANYWTSSLVTNYCIDAEDELTFLAKKLADESDAMLRRLTADATADERAIKAMSPNTLVARLDALRRGTSKRRYTEADIVAALHAKGYEVLPSEPGLPPQIRKIVPAEAPAAK
jgi:hypothetical protein